MGHDPPMDGSSEPYVVRFFSRSSPDPAPVLTRFQSGTVGGVLGAAAFFTIVLGPPLVAICALASVAGIGL
jgi:hypothetical protein